MTAFLDSNVLLYTLADGDARQNRAIEVSLGTVMVSIQVLNEFANVARRKLRMSWVEVEAALRSARALLPPPLPITVDTHERAIGLAERYDFAFYDALIVASALEAGCDTLLSEDMQHGMIVENRLTIENPFRAV